MATLQFEESCLQYQTHVDRLQKEILRLKERLENRDRVILDLNVELSQAKEDVAKM